MRHLILFLFLIYSFAVYGQNKDNTDLIVTSTGDSLHCKIVEVTAERIQFRFGPGTIIPINRSDVASYQYHFTPVRTDVPVKRTEETTPEVRIQEQDNKSSSKLKTNFGIKLGLNLANIKNETRDIEFSPKMKSGIHTGIFFNMRFGNRNGSPGFFCLQPEALYSAQGFLVDNIVVNFNYFTIPLMAKLYISDGFFVEFGPWFSFLLAASPKTAEINENVITISNMEGGKDVGIAIGAGYEFDFGLVIGARYNYGLSDMAGNLAWTNNVIAISAGWKF